MILALALLHLAIAAQTPCQGPRTIGELFEQWMVGYESSVRPGEALAAQQGLATASVPPDPIEYQIVLHAIKQVDTKMQEIMLHATERILWRDQRLRFNSTSAGGCLDDTMWHVVYSGSKIGELWSPGLGFANLQEAPTVLASAMWMKANGLVWYAREVEITARCPMTFRRSALVSHCPGCCSC